MRPNRADGVPSFAIRYGLIAPLARSSGRELTCRIAMYGRKHL